MKSEELLQMILSSQMAATQMLMDMHARLNAIESVLVTLSPRAAQLLEGRTGDEREKFQAMFEENRKQIALLREAVSNTVQ